MRVFDRDLIRGGHYGQRSCEPHLKAEHMAAPTKPAYVKKALANLKAQLGPAEMSAKWPLSVHVAGGTLPLCAISRLRHLCFLFCRARSPLVGKLPHMTWFGHCIVNVAAALAGQLMLISDLRDFLRMMTTDPPVAA
jgi:hypothetical protein